jgi:hypothetical protein
MAQKQIAPITMIIRTLIKAEIMCIFSFAQVLVFQPNLNPPAASGRLISTSCTPVVLGRSRLVFDVWKHELPQRNL